MYRILIVGAGYLGSAIAANFCAKKQKVWTVTRTDARKPSLEQMGAIPLVADITRPETLAALPAVHFIVICVAPPQGRDEMAYHETYVRGVGNLLNRVKAQVQPSLVLYISSTGVYGDKKGQWVDETHDPRPDDPTGAILLDAERQVLEAGLPSVIYRLSGIYGPSRNWIPAFKSGAWSSKPGDRCMNMMHVDDIVASIPVLFKKSECGQVYLGVDDEPVLRSEFTRWMKEKMGIKGEGDEPQKAVTGKRCRNTRLKSLGFQFKYPSYKEGYDDLIP